MLKKVGPITPTKDHLYLGKLGKTFGLKGGVRFYAVGEAEANAIFKVKEIFITSFGKRVIKNVEIKGVHTILFLVGIEDVNEARNLVNLKIYASFSNLPQPSEGNYFEMVLGKPVLVDDKEFGKVTDILALGKQDVLVVNDKHIIPLKADYVELADKAVYITNPPEGLFGLNK